MRPCDATTEKKLLSLAADNFPPSSDVWSILVGEDHVSLHRPDGGGWIEIPRAQFKALAEWYLADQKEFKP